MIERTPDEVLAPSPSREPIDVEPILAAVRARGDDALTELAAQFGDPAPRQIESREISRAFSEAGGDLRSALEGAAARIERFARAQRAAIADVSIREDDLELGHRLVAVERAGIYVPAGRHPLPSSLLMGAIPARVAGVGERIVCTPRAGREVLAAAHVAGIERVFELGGAQAIAAMAYGTRSVPRVDLIVGPGNAYVTAAKRALFGQCGIDALAGPSEIAIVAAADADADLIAVDLLAQAEHDDDARALLVTDDRCFASAVGAKIESRLATLSTAQTARASLERRGGCIVLPLSEAPEFCNRLAPEHLSLQGSRAQALADRFTAYGTLFIGEGAAEVFGDYGSGPNHVLPTGGTARFSSGLSVMNFLTLRTYERSLGKVNRRIANDAAILAQAEGLIAHRQAALARR
ncbi:MAG TPA: histidinol dehydrogenase [Candidatus Baltobacteraceae bacterium]|nr:histidinol dehydrogenase [Candidatus Baltobacteraceae bacterium]